MSLTLKYLSASGTLTFNKKNIICTLSQKKIHPFSNNNANINNNSNNCNLAVNQFCQENNFTE
jgi:hypothetical protein